MTTKRSSGDWYVNTVKLAKGPKAEETGRRMKLIGMHQILVLSKNKGIKASSYSVIELLKSPPEPKPMEFFNLKRRYQVLTIAGRDWLIKAQGF